jgi:fructose-bisphosphate aldolase, class I
MELWGGDADKIEAAQKAFHHRAKMNSAAREGDYSEEMEDQAA